MIVEALEKYHDETREVLRGRGTREVQYLEKSEVTPC